LWAERPAVEGDEMLNESFRLRFEVKLGGWAFVSIGTSSSGMGYGE
jgi:hypothetical protein